MDTYNAKNKKLEMAIQVPPLLKSYLPISIISSIAFANQGNNTWILNNFIQLFIPEGKEKLESFPFQDFMYYDQNIFQVNNVNDNNHFFSPDNIIDEIIYWLDHNNYLVVYADEYEIPDARNYKYYHILHSQFIYGYDYDLQLFFSVNFLKDESIGKFKISFDDLKSAIFAESTQKLFAESASWHNRNTLHEIILIRYLPDREAFYDHGINKEYILNEINNYYKSYNSSNFSGYFTGKLRGTWGLNVYSAIINILEKKPQLLDYRMFHLLYEHKYYMIERLTLFEISSKSTEELKDVFKSTSTLRLLCIKYNFRPNEAILRKMIHILQNIRNKEINILSEVTHKYC